MIKVIIIDDEPLARSILKEYLQTQAQLQLVAECGDGFEGLKAIQQHQPDLIFLDIQMPKITGFEMLELLEQPPSVIFTTAYDEYALKAFETHAVDYLLKPFSKERFDKSVEKFLNQAGKQVQQQNTQALLGSPTDIPGQADRIVVKTAGKIRIIPVSTINYFEAADDYVKIHTAEGSFLKNKTMAFFEKILPASQFVRTHRSYIININQVTRIEPFEKDHQLVILRTGAQIPVSQAGYGKLKQVLGL